jgi:hypothetical protein
MQTIGQAIDKAMLDLARRTQSKIQAAQETMTENSDPRIYCETMLSLLMPYHRADRSTARLLNNLFNTLR